MLNLLRMDLHRLRSSRLLVIMPLVTLGLLALCYGMMALVTDPEMLAAVQAHGGEVNAEDYAEAARVANMTMLQFLRDNLFNGGFWLCVVGFCAGLFAISDHTGGYDKNIFSLTANPRRYVAARAVSMLALNAVTAACTTLTALLACPLTFLQGRGGTAADWLWIFAAQCLTGWAFAMLMNSCAALLMGRRGQEGLMVAAVFFFSLGALPMLIGLLCETCDLPMVASLTIFVAAQCVQAVFQPVQALGIAAICLLWGLFHCLLTAALLKRRDIC